MDTSKNENSTNYNFAFSSDFKIHHHLIFWFTYFSFNVARWGSYYSDFFYSLKSNLVEFPIHIALSYFHAYFLIPKFILKRKYSLYLILLAVTLTLAYYVKFWLTYEFVNVDVWPEAIGDTKSKTLLHFVTVVLGELYIMGLTAAIKLTSDYIKSRGKNQELLRLNLETELKYLRAQIQPHFFFNTLNNLYALTIAKSDKAPEVVVKLSDLMHYVLYTAKSEKISLMEEINYLENYLDLERLRFGKRLKTNIEIEGDIDGVKIPPMLYLPFIENCFKHGIPNNNADIIINIKFKSLDKNIIFEVLNPIPSDKEVRFTKEGNGIGISNVRKRLDLNFKSDYYLDTKEENGNYRVELSIPKSI